ncbi:NMDA receptor synaptonuclear signaling and neuronal migration factor isoform X2 [Chiloscyllium plagiosum]|uniref:NMDA receptor synaptonuclear signaling and neuronal migration factor isoform X2 n=1 Tax=Chiloscyllium plagiosum TaxID=36176 RepID=UPI001CB8179E|nr:NMDA receptor synaptonuclear signaling and neuronal migration factor isoform X2 [Chiloscyllium plagiosum]
MGSAVSKRKNPRGNAICSAESKVRAAQAFREYLSQTEPSTSSTKASDHLVAETLMDPEDSSEIQQPAQNKRRLSMISQGRFDRSFSEEGSEKPADGQKPRVYTISGESQLLSEREAETEGTVAAAASTPGKEARPPKAAGGGGAGGVRCRSWAGSRQSSRECPGCAKGAGSSQLLTVEGEHVQGREAARHRKKLERMYSMDRVSDDVPIRTWFPKENLFNFQTATTTMQAISNFRKHLRMVGSRRIRVQSLSERQEKSFGRSWSDPTPVKSDVIGEPRESQELQSSCCALDDDFDDLNWEAEKELELLSCDGEGFVPPKIMLISSKVPKAEYIPTIIRRNDPSVIPILYDHEHAVFDDILEEIEKKLNAYRKGCKIWKLLIFCQGGPGHLYLLKNKVATFAKVEKEEDMILFWKRLSRLMSKINPEPNVIHIMGCYILGNPNGEKLFRSLATLMTPHRISFESPLELSAQGKRMIETYFDFRLYRLWKSRQHSKLLDYDDIL